MANIIKISKNSHLLNTRKKVAAYARVSEATDMTYKSLSAQVNYYSSLIQNNKNWEYAGVYTDAGVTGTSTKHRSEFNRLISDCNLGKIDMIIVKSISRFARDTVDCLKTTRELKNIGVEVYFEREKISSLSADGELMLTLLSSFAQEESKNISDNVKWAIRKRFEKGIPNGHKAPYGYRWDGEVFRIIPEEGKVVKELFKRYLAGESAYGIAKDMASRGVVGQQGNPIEQTTLKEILSSISYTGTMVLQKNYIAEDKSRKRNNGELPVYIVENMFEPLISLEEHYKAKKIRKDRADAMANKNPILTPFSGLVKCGSCAGGISRRTSGNKKRWVCNTKERKGMSCCDSRPIDETELISATSEVLGIKKFSKDYFISKIEKVIVYGDVFEFILKNGKIKTVKRVYTGKRGSNPFTNKLSCFYCEDKCRRDKINKKTKVWNCSRTKGKCNMRRLLEDDLINASSQILGDDYAGKVVRYINKINISDDTLFFKFKSGEVKKWQRK